VIKISAKANNLAEKSRETQGAQDLFMKDRGKEFWLAD